MRLGLFILLLILFPSSAFANGVPDTGAIDVLLQTFENAAGTWPDIIKQYTIWVFWSLVTISWAWTFGEMALKGGGIQDVLVELTRRTILIGFFFWLFTDATKIASAIVEGFQFIAIKLGANPIKASSIFDMGYSIGAKILKKLSLTKPAESMMFALAGLAILVIFAFISLQLLLVTIQYYVLLNAGVVMMGFLGHEWSREYGIAYFRLMLGLGVKFFTMQLIIVLSMSVLNNWIQTSDLTWTQVLLMLPIACVIWGLNREVPLMAQSLVSGSDSTTGDSLAGALQAATTMAAVAAGAYAGAGALAKGMAGGGANIGSLLGNAWQQAGELGDSDPGVDSLPDSESSDYSNGDSSGFQGGGDDFGDYQGELSGETDSAAETSSETPQTSESNASNASSESAGAAKMSPLKKAGIAAKIAGAAIASEGLNSAKSAFKKGMLSNFSSNQNSVVGRAAQTLAAAGDVSTNTGSVSDKATAGGGGKSSTSSTQWWKGSGGFDGLNNKQKIAASLAHQEWLKADDKHSFGLKEYVSYTQEHNK